MNQKNENYIPALSYNWLTPFYDTAVKWTVREAAFKGQLIEQAAIQGQDKILDVGCGTATLTIAIKKAYPGAEVTGLDGDPKILGIASQKAQRAGTEIKFIEGLSSEMPFPDQYFDKVVSSLFFHHLNRASKEQTLLQIRRVLKPGGLLHIADWGKPANTLMRAVSQTVVLFDGAETTGDNFAGRLPGIVENAGFCQVEETATFNSLFGTLRLWKARNGTT
jgi:ubiquinone/menaquinone biosynthesis C-methylase UbiE